MSAKAPYRVDVADSQAAVLAFARDAAGNGKAALAFLTEIRGGAARTLGAMVAVNHRGGYCGYVSGGCVEAAVAAEALQAMEDGCDRHVLFGEGSSFFDIALPCGGGLTISIHLVKQPDIMERALSMLQDRQLVRLSYLPQDGLLKLEGHAGQSGWLDEKCFAVMLRPELRLAISGAGLEARALTRIAEAAGYQTLLVDEGLAFDPWTAVIFLRHDIEAELGTMVAALNSNAGYIGALGSRKTHGKRVERLVQEGLSQQAIERIHAPIGLFGPTRHSSALALSILAQIASLEGIGSS